MYYFYNRHYRLLFSFRFWLDCVYTLICIALVGFLIKDETDNFTETKQNNESQKSISSIANTETVKESPGPTITDPRIFLYRQLETIAVIVIYIKGFAHLKLNDSMSPLIDTIRQILKDIKSFMIVIAYFGVCFAICFYLLG